MRLSSLVSDYRAANAAFVQQLPAGAPVPALLLRDSSRADVVRAAEAIADSPLVWADDGFCAARAHLGAFLINTTLGSGQAGPTDAAIAGRAMQRMGSTPLAGRWQYHVAPAMRQGDDLLVFDPVSMDRPVPIDEWRAAMGATRPPQLLPVFESKIEYAGRAPLSLLEKARLRSRPASAPGVSIVPNAAIDRFSSWMNSTWHTVREQGVVPAWPQGVRSR